VWQASVRLLDLALPYHSCSLLVGIENYRAAESRHHVVAGDYFNFGSAALVSVSGPFLRAHPRIKQYTYNEVIETDPEAPLRRLEKEVTLSAWDQFVHLVFWRRNAPDGLFSVRRTAVQGDFSAAENDFLRQFRTDLGAALQRLRKLQRERSQQAAGTLSGGEQQMLAVARALMLGPRLLLLDEPSLGLAPLIVREIFRILRAANRDSGVTILLVEQNASLALDLADHVFLLETGRVVMEGPSEVLRKGDAIRKSYLGY
jgi:ABC-type dipeptide/oligopeptide/nickel transport system ATPase component